MQLLRIKIAIAGITPLMLNRFTDEAQIAATSGTRSSSNGGDRGTPREIAESKLYLSAEGVPVVPAPNLLRCLVDGGSFHKIGKRQVTTSKSSLLYACASIVGLDVPIIHTQPWSVDARPVVNPSTKGRFLGYRPRFDDWRLEFECELENAIIAAKLFRHICDDAGKKIGLGDFRPACKGPMGRFVVAHWEEKELDVPIDLKRAA